MDSSFVHDLFTARIEREPVGRTTRLRLHLTVSPKDPAKGVFSVSVAGPDLADPVEVGGLDGAALAPTVGLLDDKLRKWIVEREPVDAEVGDVDRRTRQVVSFERSNDTRAAAPVRWSLSVTIGIKPDLAGKLAFRVQFGEDTAIPVTLDVPVPRPPAEMYRLRLFTNVGNPSRLRVGDEFHLQWQVQGTDTKRRGARLVGAFPAGTPNATDGELPVTDTVADEFGSLSLVCMGPAVYTLTALIEGKRVNGQPGEPVELQRTLVVGLQVPACAGTLSVLPTVVFPRGPMACVWAGFRIARFAIDPIGGGPSVDDPKAKTTEDVKASTWSKDVAGNEFALNFGPREAAPGKEDVTWRITGRFSDKDDRETTQSVEVKATSLRRLWSSLPAQPGVGLDPWHYAHLAADALAETPGEEAPRAEGSHYPQERAERAISAAAGRFRGRKWTNSRKKGDYAIEVPREWIAVVTDHELEMHVRELDHSYRLDGGAHVRTNWLGELRSPNFRGVGAAVDVADPTSDWVVAIHCDPSVAVMEFRFPLQDSTQSLRDLVVRRLDDRFADGSKPVRVLSIGSRVYIVGDDLVQSYSRRVVAAGREKVDTEATLRSVASPDWELAAIPAKAQSADETGAIYALNRTRGAFLRFDVTNGVVTGPWELATAHANRARLRLVHDAQASGSLYPRAKINYRSEPIRISAVNPIQRLMVVDGALLARNEIADGTVGGAGTETIIRDRAYDPRLDVWVRCGHPFYDVTAKDKPLYFWTNSTLYCRTGDGVITYVERVNRSHLGFLRSAPLRPIAYTALRGAKGKGASAAVGATFAPGDYLLSQECGWKLLFGENALTLYDPYEAACWTVPLATALAKAQIEPTGELVFYGADNARISGSADDSGEFAGAEPGARLVVESDGRVEIRSGAGAILWRRRPGPCTQLADGDWLAPGESVAVGKARLSFGRHDGSLVLTQGGTVAWSAKVSAGKAHRCTLLRSGDLVIRAIGRSEPLWSSVQHGGESASRLIAKLEITASGAAQITDNVSVWWHCGRTFVDVLPAGEWLAPGERVVSANGELSLVYQQEDGDLVFFNGTTKVWAASGAGLVKSAAAGWRVQVRSGELRIQRGPDDVGWRSGDWGGWQGETPDRSQLCLEAGPRLVVRSETQTLLWRSPQEHKHALKPGEWLAPDEFLQKGDIKLTYAANGEIRLTRKDVVLWRLQAKPKSRLEVWQDGNFGNQGAPGDLTRVWYATDHTGCFRATGISPVLEVLDTGHFQVRDENTGRITFHSRWVRVKNINGHWLCVTPGQEHGDEWIHTTAKVEEARWWELLDVDGRTQFALLGHKALGNLPLVWNWDNGSGHLKLWIYVGSTGNSVTFTLQGTEKGVTMSSSYDGSTFHLGIGPGGPNVDKGGHAETCHWILEGGLTFEGTKPT